ncbi:hypothetical protein [Spiroplasma endosymbiont of Calodromius spilotus]|uniref:hypothetical protein n=1 Tax=Spiroplasma endosymbiont of Calodromius spilotus TaxID=3077929 RepID=UPI0031FEB2CF
MPIKDRFFSADQVQIFQGNLKIIQQISQKYKNINIKPEYIKFKNIIDDVIKIELWKIIFNNLNIKIQVTNLDYWYKGWTNKHMKLHYEQAFLKPTIELLYYPFILSVVSDIVLYYSENLKNINREKCIKNALDIINVLQELIVTGKTVFKLDGYFQNMLKSWNLVKIFENAKLQKYDQHVLLLDYSTINYKYLYFANLLSIYDKVTNVIQNSLPRLYTIPDEYVLFEMVTNKASPFKIWFNHQINLKVLPIWRVMLTSTMLSKRYDFLSPSNFDLKIKLSELETIGKVKIYFDNKIFDFNDHKLTILNTQKDAFNLVWKLTNEMCGGRHFKLEMEHFQPQKKLLNNSIAIESGESFNFKIIMLVDVGEFKFKIKHVLTFEQLMNIVAGIFSNVFDFNEHHLMVTSTQRVVYNFILEKISFIVGKYLRFKVEIQNFQATKQIFEDEKYDIIENKISFNFIIIKENLYFSFIFEAKNILTSLKVLEKVKQYFLKTFDFNEHKLTVYDTMRDAYNIAKILIKKIIGEKISFEIVPNNISLDKKIAGTSLKVLAGDFINFNMNILGNTINFDFKFAYTIVNNYILYKFFQQVFDLNLSSINLVKDAFVILKTKLLADLPKVYSLIKNISFTTKYKRLENLNLFDLMLAINSKNIWETKSLKMSFENLLFKIKLTFQEQEHIFIIYLSNVKLVQSHLVQVVKMFFAQEYYWNILTINTGMDVLDKAKIELNKMLGEELAKLVELNLKDPRDFNLLNQVGNNFWNIVIKVNDEEILDCENDLKIKLVGIKDDHQIFKDKVIDFLINDVKDWGLTTEHNGWFVLNKARAELEKLIDTDIMRVKIELIHSDEEDLQKFYNIKNSLGINYWYVSLEIDNLRVINPSMFFTIRIWAILSRNELIVRVINFLNQEHDWDLTDDNDGFKVIEIANKQLKLYLEDDMALYSRVELRLKYLESYSFKNKIESSEWAIFCLVDNEVIPNPNDKIKLRLINITKSNYNIIISKIIDFFANDIEFTIHGLFTNNVRADAYNFVKNWITENFTYNLVFELKMQGDNDSKSMSSPIINNSRLIPTGDWFDFNIKIGSKTGKFRFKAKNIPKNMYECYVIKIKELFACEFNYSQHLLTINNTREDCKNLVSNWIREIIYDVPFALEIVGSSTVAIRNNSRVVSNGDYIDFQVEIGSEKGEFKLKVKNVAKNENQGVVFKIIHYFEQVFDFNTHQLTQSHSKQNVFNLVNYWITHIFTHNLPFNLTIADPDPINTYLINNSPEVPTGDWAKFTIFIGDEGSDFIFKIKNVGINIDKNLILEIKSYFSNRFFQFNEHKLTTNNTILDVYNFVYNWIELKFTKGIQFALYLKEIDILKIGSVDNTRKLSRVEFIDFILFLGEEKEEFIFKVKSVKVV